MFRVMPLIYKLEYNILRVWELPSMAHDATANALIVHFTAWSQNYNMLATETLTIWGGDVSNLFNAYF